jgi:hypothetical protein
MSFLAHQAAYRTTRWAAWRLKNRDAIKAERERERVARMTPAEYQEYFDAYIHQDTQKGHKP